jgi:two-component system cell cycle sensor histidine kinase/response regulator CckA
VGSSGTKAWFLGDDLVAFTAYWDVFEARRVEIMDAVRPEIAELAPSFANPDNVQWARDSASEMVVSVRQAIVDGDWGPVAASVEDRAAQMARLGVRFDEWSDLLLLSQRHGTPLLVVAHAGDPTFLAAVIAAMQDFWRRAIRTARARYTLVRESIDDERQRALQRSEARFRRLSEAGILGILVTDSNGGIREANDAFLKMLGYTREELDAGALRWDVLTPPEWAEVSRELVSEVERVGGAGPREKAYVHKNGTQVPVLVGSAALDSETNITFVLDLADRRRAEDAQHRSEQLFRAIVEASPDAVSLLDREARFLYASPMAAEIAGRSNTDMVGLCAFDLIAPHDLEVYKKRWQECIDQPGVRQRHTFRMVAPDGTIRYRESLRVNHLDDPNVRAIVTLVRDITEAHRLEEQLRQSQKMEAIGTLAGGVAHDFNNLLSVIIGYSDVLLLGLRETDPMRSDVKEISDAGKRAAALTGQLLAFSRKQVLEPRIVRLASIVDGMVQLIRRLIGEDIELVTLNEDSVGNVMADPGQMEQVLLNLVVNARDAMPDGGKLVVETSDVTLDGQQAASLGTAPGPHVMMAVSDSGTGMDAATVARIFEPFFTTKAARGTGLGLSTVFGIVRQSGGAISVYSEPGQGTTFRVYLPRTDAVADQPAQVARPTKARGTETILLVEDDDSVRHLAREILRRQGYKVLEASNPGEGFLVAEQHAAPIDLLVTDVVMPKMTGREFARKLGVLRPAMKVLYMSGHTENTIVHNGVLEPGIVFMPKPFTLDGLLRKVREILDRH